MQMNATNLNYTNVTVPVVGLDVDLNITGLKVAESSVNASMPIIKINEDSGVFQFSDLNLNFTFDYFYVTNPPILADMGSAWIAITALDLNTSLTTTFNQSDELLQVQLSDITIETSNPQPFLLFNGVADYSQVVTSLLDTLTAIIRNRIISIVNQQVFTPKVNTFANKVLSLFPTEIPLMVGN